MRVFVNCGFVCSNIQIGAEFGQGRKMENPQFQVIQDQSVYVMKFVLPELIDTMEIDALMNEVLRALEQTARERWIMELNEVAYLGSSMLGLMVNIRERIRQADGRLVLCGLSPQLLRIFQACCLERLFTIVKTRTEAMTRLTRE
jgi:anti-anti-sigma factor